MRSEAKQPARASAARTECPRCGYDFDGVIASWGVSCPLEGRCSECGLEFSWRAIFNGQLHGPEWSFEHSRWNLLGCFARTCARCARPAGPWWGGRAMRIEHHIEPGRLLLFPVLVAGLFHALCVAVALGWQLLTSPGRAVGMTLIDIVTNEGPRLLLNPYGDRYGNMLGGIPLIVVVGLVSLWAVMPLLMLVLGQTFRRTRVRRVHLIRGLAYSLPSTLAAAVVAVIGLGIADACRRLLGVAVPLEESLVLLLALGGPVYQGLWWGSFVRRYLRLPHAAVVAVVLMLVSVLACVTFWLCVSVYVFL